MHESLRTSGEASNRVDRLRDNSRSARACASGTVSVWILVGMVFLFSHDGKSRFPLWLGLPWCFRTLAARRVIRLETGISLVLLP